MPETEQELYRREAMGAFAHEVRTPLTSIRMVLELASREADGKGLTLDAELAAMLNSSVDDLQQLADDLQEASRLERHKLLLGRGPCDLRAAVEAARELLGHEAEILGDVPEHIEGPWDVPRMVRAIAGFTRSTNRIGDGCGVVGLAFEHGGNEIRLGFSSGEPGGDAKEIGADAGFSFFRSRLFVMAMGGALDWERSNRYFRMTAHLPLE
jgi:signal transduction histidine kinase